MKIKKIFLVILGVVSLILGAAGIILPLLPTTPLVLLSAFCFSASNKKLERWLLRNRLFGPFIDNYRTGRGISRFHKTATIIFLWTGLLFSMAVIRITWIYLILSIVGTSVTVHILKIKTKK